MFLVSWCVRSHTSRKKSEGKDNHHRHGRNTTASSTGAKEGGGSSVVWMFDRNCEQPAHMLLHMPFTIHFKGRSSRTCHLTRVTKATVVVSATTETTVRRQSRFIFPHGEHSCYARGKQHGTQHGVRGSRVLHSLLEAARRRLATSL